MWITDPFLEKSFKVIKSWGFTYKTVAFTWAKQNKKSDSFFTGLGYWTRANPEMCLLATKGKPKRVSKSVKQLIMSRLQTTFTRWWAPKNKSDPNKLKFCKDSGNPS